MAITQISVEFHLDGGDYQVYDLECDFQFTNGEIWQEYPRDYDDRYFHNILEEKGSFTKDQAMTLLMCLDRHIEDACWDYTEEEKEVPSQVIIDAFKNFDPWKVDYGDHGPYFNIYFDVVEVA